MRRLIQLIKSIWSRLVKSQSQDIINWNMPTCESNVLSRFNLLEKSYLEQIRKIEVSGEEEEVVDISEKLQGNYSVEGHNAGASEKNYFGELELKNMHGKLYKALWRIGFDRQVQKGVGILVGNKLALDFYYTEDNQRYYGLVIYKVSSQKTLKGFWIEPGVEGVGFEECQLKNAL